MTKDQKRTLIALAASAVVVFGGSLYAFGGIGWMTWLVWFFTFGGLVLEMQKNAAYKKIANDDE